MRWNCSRYRAANSRLSGQKSPSGGRSLLTACRARVPGSALQGRTVAPVWNGKVAPLLDRYPLESQGMMTTFITSSALESMSLSPCCVCSRGSRWLTSPPSSKSPERIRSKMGS